LWTEEEYNYGMTYIFGRHSCHVFPLWQYCDS